VLLWGLERTWKALADAGINTRSTHVRKIGLSRVGDVVHVFNYGLTETEIANITKAVEAIGLMAEFHKEERIAVSPGGY
jgi:hypothetical protein